MIKLTSTTAATALMAAALLGGIGSAFAQDASYNQIAPKPVKPSGPGQVNNPPPPKAAAEDATVVLKKLDALVFVPSPDAVKKDGLAAKQPVTLNGVSVPDEAAFDALVTPYIGKKLTHGQLNELITGVILYYRAHDRPVVDVIVPVQKITSGTIQIVILEGKVGQVTVTGNRWFPSAEIRNNFDVQPGDTIRASRVQGDLDWVNQNPFHTSDLIYQPGAKLGQTDMVLQTKDRFPVRFYTGYENNGNTATGLDRYEAGFNWGDAFGLGLGQQLNYQYTMSGDGQGLQAHSGSYLIPLPWHHTLEFFGSYADTKGSIPPFFNLDGRSSQVSGRYDVPLPTLHWADNLAYKQTVGAGFDYKYNKNSLLFGGALSTTGSTLYSVDQFVLTYDGTETDAYGQTTISDQLYLSPGDFGGSNNDLAFAAAHTGATSDYVYNYLVLERTTRLPQDFSLVLRGTVQASNGNLAPSEQLGFGGFDSVRGYDEREVNADEGYIFTTEIRSPSISLGDLFHFSTHDGSLGFNDQLQFLAFWDYGSASNHTLLPGEAKETYLSSVGAGLRYSINSYLSVRYDLGFQLHSTGLDNDHGSRSELGIVFSY